MPLKIFHTGDIHLGMTFKTRNYPEHLRKRLVDARHNTLAKMVERANQEKCDVFMIAGDLFHRTSIPREAVLKTLEIMSKFNGSCVAVLPGNHDYYDEFSPLWKNVRDNAFDSLVLLSEIVPYSLAEYGLDAVLYPAPCDRKHSPENKLGWIRELEERPGARWHLGAAHGSVRGISPDFESQYFPMEEGEIFELKLDHCFIGHTHIRYPDLDNVSRAVYAYCGTPEPDGFDCSHQGFAWITTMDEEGNLESESITTGEFRFREIKKEIHSLEELEELIDEFVEDGENNLVKLVLTGSLPQEDYQSRLNILAEMEQCLVYIEVDDSDLCVEISPHTISAEFSEGSFPYLLLSNLAQRGENEALQLAYQLIKKVKK